jgi:hypothetical protein
LLVLYATASCRNPFGPAIKVLDAMSVLTLRMTAGAAGVEEARRRGSKAVVVWMRPKRLVSTAERMEGRWG